MQRRGRAVSQTAATQPKENKLTTAKSCKNKGNTTMDTKSRSLLGRKQMIKPLINAQRDQVAAINVGDVNAYIIR